MPTLADGEPIKLALATPSTCTSKTVDLLRTLLNGSGTAKIPEPPPQISPPATKNRKQAKNAPKGRSNATPTPVQSTKIELKPAERVRLATEVINICLKSLSQEVQQRLRKPPLRSSLKPTQPLAARSQNVPPTPTQSTKNGPVAVENDGIKYVVECARISLAALRKYNELAKKPLPEYQIESAMSALISKLLSLDMGDPAVKETRLLTGRLDMGPKTTDTTNKSPATQDRIALVEFLHAENYMKTPQKLLLVVATQLHILRLLQSTKATPDPHRLFELTDLSTPAPPSILVTCASAIDGEEKCIRQLGQIARSILAIADRIHKKPKVNPEQKPDVHSGILNLRVLSLEIFWMTWMMAKHKTEIHEEFSEPLFSYINMYLAETMASEGDKLQTVETAINKAIGLARKAKLSKQQQQELDQADLDFNRVLQRLALTAGAHEKHKAFTKKSLTELSKSNISAARRATILTQSATSAIQTQSSDAGKFLPDAIMAFMSAAVDDSDSSHLDDLLIAVTCLRKACAGKLPKKVDPEVSPKAGQIFKTPILKAAAFVVRYLGELPAKASSRILERYQYRKSLVKKIAPGTIESIAQLSRHLGQDIINCKDFSQGIEDCETLVERLGLTDGDRYDENPQHLPISLILSNIYWQQYLAARIGKSDSTTQLLMLEQSIKLIEDLPIKQRESGLFPLKLERLAAAYKQLQAWSRAYQVYQRAFRFYCDTGLVEKAANKLKWSPVIRSLIEEPEFKVFDNVIEAYCTVIYHVPKGTSPLLPVSTLSPILQGFVLEFQINALQHPTLQGREDQDLCIIAEIGQALMDIYDEKRYPLRRLRAFSSIIECGLILPEKTTTTVQDAELDPEELVMLPYKEHLLAQKTALIALKELKQSKLLLQALQQWVAIVEHKSVTNWNGLLARICDIPGWYKLLEAIVEFAQAYGLTEQRILALDMLAYTAQLPDRPAKAPLPEYQIQATAGLAAELVQLGFIQQAAAVLDFSKHHLVTAHSEAFRFEWYIARAMCSTKTGDLVTAESALHASEELFDRMALTLSGKSHFYYLMQGRISFEHALLASAAGKATLAFQSIRHSIRAYLLAWNFQQRKFGAYPETDPEISTADGTIPGGHGAGSSSYWPIVQPMFEAYMYAASLLLNAGLASEGRYYASEAYRIASQVGATAYIVRALHLQGELEAKSGNETLAKMRYVRSQTILDNTKHLSPTQLGLLKAEQIIHASQYDEKWSERLDEAFRLVNQINPYKLLLFKPIESNEADLTNKLNNLSLSDKQSKPSSKTISKVTTASKKQSQQTPAKGKQVVSTKTDSTILPSVIHRLRLAKAKYYTYITQYEDAITTLSMADIYNDPTEGLQNVLLTAKVHVLQGLQTVELDPMWNLIPEATIAYPSTKPQAPVAVNKPGRTPKKSTAAIRGKTPANEHQSHFEQAVLAASVADLDALKRCTTTEGHAWSCLHVKSTLGLSALAPSSQAYTADRSGVVRNHEYGRNIASIRADAAILADKLVRDVIQGQKPGPIVLDDAEKILMEPKLFQSEYVDIIPNNWHVVSLSLSEDSTELRIATFRAGITPLILSIPMTRGMQDEPEHAFSYHHVKAELKRIIDLANYSTHEQIDQKQKGIKARWWEERSTLDARLRDILASIQTVWFGGFRGLLQHHHIDDELLLGFTIALNKILNKYLPSRQSKKGTKSATVGLDTQIVELFVRLGRPDDDESINEQIIDLLYFIVDIYWFNGEHNACDELELSQMVAEIRDALSSYHDQIHKPSNDDTHTILILDKRLHAFPWESLPCMVSQSVSRLTSLQFLRSRILTMQKQSSKSTAKSGIIVDPTSGAYILNPAGDLTNTQSTFQEPLAKLHNWSSKVFAVPTETEISTALSTKSIYLYFGHGSGGQYIRSRTIRRLDSCAVALLMGCSSGSLTEAGEYESFGVPLNYMHAGAPAIVGTLWDVTDKDIDKFALKMLQDWGLFSDEEKATIRAASPTKKGPKVKGKGKAETNSAETKKVSLDTAVAGARGECIMRYLNGAAPVVYGVPVFLK